MCLVYAAYGEYLVSWNATSGERFQTFEITNEFSGVKEDEDSDYYGYYYSSWVNIQSLLLVDDRLMVIVDGNFDPEQGDVSRALGGYRHTRVLVYNVGQDGSELNFVTKKDINGYYSAVRAERGNIHLVTMSGVNMYQFLGSPFEVYPDYSHGDTSPVRNLTAFLSQIRSDADERYIPEFINQLESELTVDGVFPNTVRLCRWQTEQSDDPLEDFVYSDGFVNSVALVTSFNIASAPEAISSEMGVHTSAAFLPSYGEAYAASGMLLISTTGYDYNPERNRMMERTYMLALVLDEAPSTPHAIGAVDGYFLNQRSFDIFDGTVRAATSIRNFWAWERDRMNQESSTENLVVTLDLPSAKQDETHVMNVLDQM